jgi:hypothetical protein
MSAPGLLYPRKRTFVGGFCKSVGARISVRDTMVRPHLRRSGYWQHVRRCRPRFRLAGLGPWSEIVGVSTEVSGRDYRALTGPLLNCVDQ